MGREEREEQFLENYENTLEELANTFFVKNERYGNSFTDTIEDYGLVASIVRLTDKFNRMTTLYKNKELDCDDEPIIDTMLDMANYLIMTVAYLKNSNGTLKLEEQ
ncbi:DUF1599 domain-containing protein [Peptoniphilus sp. AGMB00490]|uniref:DUF1599 domain-containing protein n=1 Tax=Peptoniphilus faecalis TaxID=2731255 RepID=A0A848RA55_9FIRM|nr:nucleotide modification associated domain-containing protein [Peptoniphilus faecalis]NMW84698.1 DUF1599 domain-containing protein [Peptoniphilus faecalis]